MKNEQVMECTAYCKTCAIAWGNIHIAYGQGEHHARETGHTVTVRRSTYTEFNYPKKKQP